MSAIPSAQVAFLACLLLLAGCGGGGGGSDSTPSSSAPMSASSANTSSASSQSSSKIPDTLIWKRPTLRENKFTLAVNDIGGYVVRYKLAKDRTYAELNLPSKGDVISVPISDIPNGRTSGMQFEVAAYTYDGLFSEFSTVYLQ